MIGQSLYYLNNKKYITNITNAGTIVDEMNNFYHTREPRPIKVVHPSMEDTQLFASQMMVEAEAKRTGVTPLFTFHNWEDANTVSFIEDNQKCIIAYTDESDMLHVFARYTAGLLYASQFYADTEHQVDAIAAHFIDKVVESDTLLTIMTTSDSLNDARNYCTTVLSNADTPRYNVAYQNGKNFSYDLLFFLHEHYPCTDVANLIIEKFTVHSSEIVRDVMEQFTAQRRDMAYIISVIDWMNTNATDANEYTTDKTAFINKVFVTPHVNGNWTVPFYALNELWDKVKDDAAFIAAHTSKTNPIGGWEYNDQYNEINNLIPTVKKVLERTWNADNLTAELKLLDTDVQFFSKRQNRIPYLIHKYTL